MAGASRGLENRRRSFRSPWLPDAAALQFGAYARHRAGHTGRGTRVLLVDNGIGAPTYFSDRRYRWLGATQRENGHGTGMAAIIFAIAPDAEVWSMTVREMMSGAIPPASFEPDIVLCAWTRPASITLNHRLEAIISRVVTTPQALGSALSAAGAPLATVRLAAPLPALRLPGTTASWQGHSVAAAAFAATCLLFPKAQDRGVGAAVGALSSILHVTQCPQESP